MSFVAITIVGARLVGIDAIGIVQALLRVRCDARGATTADITRMVIRADRRCSVSITDDRAATVRTASVSRLARAVVELFTATTNIGFIEKAFERAFG